MPLSTYTELQASIVTYAFRQGDTEFTAAVPTFVALCESRLNRKLRLREQETTDTLSVTSGASDLPYDFLELREIKGSDGLLRVLENASPGFGGTLYPNAAAGTSNYYSISGDVLTTYPPSSSGLSITYYAKIPPLADTESNWLLTKAPEVYLYGSLVEAAPFMMDDGRLATWGALFERALQDLINDDVRSKYSKVGIRVRNHTP